MTRYGRVGMNGIEKSSRPQVDSCHRSKKNIKDSINQVKDDLELLQEVLNRDLADYSSTTESIGRHYMRLISLEQELKEHKKQGKK